LDIRTGVSLSGPLLFIPPCHNVGGIINAELFLYNYLMFRLMLSSEQMP